MCPTVEIVSEKPVCRWGIASSWWRRMFAVSLVALLLQQECATGDTITVYRDAVFFKVIRPTSLSYVFKALPARNFGASFGNYPRPAYLIQAKPAQLCETATNGEEFDGAMVLVERGGCSFLSKALHAQDQRAAAVLIYDHEIDNFSSFVDMVDDKSGRADEVTIPVAFVLGIDGYHLSSSLADDPLLEHIDILIPLNITREPDLLTQLPPWSLY